MMFGSAKPLLILVIETCFASNSASQSNTNCRQERACTADEWAPTSSLCMESCCTLSCSNPISPNNLVSFLHGAIKSLFIFFINFCLSHSPSNSGRLFATPPVFHSLHCSSPPWALSVSPLSSLPVFLSVSFLCVCVSFLLCILLTSLPLRLPPRCLQEQTGVEPPLSV